MFWLMSRRPSSSTLFPYTTLFRSHPRITGELARPEPVAEYRDRAFLPGALGISVFSDRSEEHTSELQSRVDLVCRLLLEKKKYYNVFRSERDARYGPSRRQPDSSW